MKPPDAMDHPATESNNAPTSPQRHWDTGALWTVAVLAAWAGVFWYLWVSGGWALHVSSRIFWVVPFGAIVLTAGAIGRLIGARRSHGSRFTTRQAAALALLAVPVAIILAMPSTALGTYAAARRGVYTGGVSVTDIGAANDPQLQIAVSAALYEPDVLKALAKRAGDEVTFTGFVTHEAGTLSDEFQLNRFVVTCCIADALNALVRVVDVTGGPYKSGQWVTVTGALYPLQDEILLDAGKITSIPRPKHPYLNG